MKEGIKYTLTGFGVLVLACVTLLSGFHIGAKIATAIRGIDCN